MVMGDTPGRMLELLSLLQARRSWGGVELAARLGVTERTVRRDVERLRLLGYPVEAVPGRYGGYQLGRGGRLPPLLFNNDEAAAIAIGLRSAIDGSVAGAVRFDWNALDAWFEEDEEVFVHPRNPYTRVDALRSTRRVRIELDGALLAESSSPVMVFETGLPTRYYLNRTEVNFSHLVPTETVTACPYKGWTSGYWTVRVGDATYPDLAWAYDFPTRQVLPIAGMIAFYNEKVDITVDGEHLPRPRTHFFR